MRKKQLVPRKCLLCGKKITGRWYCRDCYRSDKRSPSRMKADKRHNDKRKNVDLSEQR